MCEFMSEVPFQTSTITSAINSEMISELIAEFFAELMSEMALPSFHKIAFIFLRHDRRKKQSEPVICGIYSMWPNEIKDMHRKGKWKIEGRF